MAFDRDEEIHAMAIKWKIDLDKKSQDEATTAGNNMIGLISDLAIIGKVAGEALSKMWSGMQQNIKVGIETLDDINIAGFVGVDPEDMQLLKYALEKIGANAKDAPAMLKSLDALAQSFTSPETGEQEMANFMEQAGRFGLAEKDRGKLIEALENRDLVEAIKLFGETRWDQGEEFSNFMKEFNLEPLSFLELDYQYEDWLNAWATAGSRLWDVNTEALDKLEDGWTDIGTSMDLLKKRFGELSGEGINRFGAAMLKITEKFLIWSDTIETFNNSMYGIWDTTMAFLKNPSEENEEKMGKSVLEGSGSFLKMLKIPDKFIPEIYGGSLGGRDNLEIDRTQWSEDQSGISTKGGDTIINLYDSKFITDNPETFGKDLEAKLDGYGSGMTQ